MRAKIRRHQTPKGIRWYLSTVDDGTETAHGGFKTQREAKAKAAEIIADAGRGHYVSPSKLTVAQYLLGEWLAARENADISPSTRSTERIVVTSWVNPHIGTIPLQKLNARDLDGLYRTLRDHGGRGGRPLSGKSTRNVHGVLSKACGDAVRRGHLTVNPASAVDPPARDDSVERTAWKAEEVRRFLGAAAADRLSAVWRLVLATGVRRGELLGVCWDDFNLDPYNQERNPEGCSVRVSRQVLVRPGVDGRTVYVRNTTKTRRTRRVRFDESTASALRSWKAAQAAERLEFGPAWKTDGGLGVDATWVVTEPDGGVVHPATLGARWDRLVVVAGVTPITLHAARHTHAELALAAGVRLDVVSRQLGHASIATTADIYLHDDDEAAAAAATLVGAVLEGGR